MEHTWFKDIDWQKMKDKGMVSPYSPQLDNPFDVKYFDIEFTSQKLSFQDCAEKSPLECVEENKQSQTDSRLLEGYQTDHCSTQGGSPIMQDERHVKVEEFLDQS